MISACRPRRSRKGASGGTVWNPCRSSSGRPAPRRITSSSRPATASRSWRAGARLIARRAARASPSSIWANWVGSAGWETGPRSAARRKPPASATAYWSCRSENGCGPITIRGGYHGDQHCTGLEAVLALYRHCAVLLRTPPSAEEVVIAARGGDRGGVIRQGLFHLDDGHVQVEEEARDGGPRAPCSESRGTRRSGAPRVTGLTRCRLVAG